MRANASSTAAVEARSIWSAVHRVAGRAQLVDQRLRALAAAVEAGVDDVAALGEALRHDRAEPAARAGDEDDARLAI